MMVLLSWLKFYLSFIILMLGLGFGKIDSLKSLRLSEPLL